MGLTLWSGPRRQESRGEAWWLTAALQALSPHPSSFPSLLSYGTEAVSGPEAPSSQGYSENSWLFPLHLAGSCYTLGAVWASLLPESLLWSFSHATTEKILITVALFPPIALSKWIFYGEPL